MKAEIYDYADWWDEDGYWTYEGEKWELERRANDKCDNTDYK